MVSSTSRSQGLGGPSERNRPSTASCGISPVSITSMRSSSCPGSWVFSPMQRLGSSSSAVPECTSWIVSRRSNYTTGQM